MFLVRRRTGAALGVAAIAAVSLAGCASAGTGEARQVPPARMVQTGRTKSVQLTPLGAQRIGIATARPAAKGTLVVVPFDALLYEPDGRTAVYVQTARLTYTRHFITVWKIAGDQVFVRRGLTADQPVVTVGAEELLGVQNGVGVQT
jgi:hypothetical protein